MTAIECPRISQAFLEQERATLGEFTYRTEYECEFQEDATQVFGQDWIEAAFTSDFPALWAPAATEVAV